MPALTNSRCEGRIEVASKQSLIASFSYYTVARYASECLFVLRGFMLAHVLGPALFGVWTQMKMAFIFLQYSQLGANEAMMREVPYAIGRGQHARGDAIKRTVLGFNLISSLAVTGMLACMGLFWLQGAGEARVPWLLFACAFPLSQLYWYLQTRCRAQMEFSYVALMLVSFSIASTVIGVVAAHRYGIEGFLVALVGSYLLILCGAWLTGHRLPRPSWNPLMLGEMLRSGFPIMVSGAMLILLWNLDKLAIWIFLSPESLGIYSLPTYLIISVAMLPEGVSAVLYPRLMDRIGTARSTAFLERYLTRPTLIVSYLACPLLGVLFLALHLPIQWLLPKYLLSIMPGKVLIAAVFFMLVTRIPYVILLSLKRQNLLFALTAISVGVGAVTIGGLLRAGADLVGAAAGVGVGFLVYTCLLMTVTLRALQLGSRRVAWFLAATLAPYFVTIAAVSSILALIPETELSLVSDLGYTSLRCAILLSVSVVCLLVANSRLRFLRAEALA